MSTTDLAYLDNLSNRELREKCLQYNLPNVPITDSVRKLMLKRLRAAILGTDQGQAKSATKTKTTRRETIQTTTKSPGRTNNTNSTKTNKRHTIANEPANVTRARKVHTTTTLSSSDIGSNSDEYDYDEPEQYTFAISPKQQPLRRSVSLSKTGVLTTSYTQETTPLRTYGTEDDELDNGGREMDWQSVPSNIGRPQYSVLSSQRAEINPLLPGYEPMPERKVQHNVSFAPRSQLSQTQLNTNSYSGMYGMNVDNATRNSYAGSSVPFGSTGLNTSRPYRSSVGSTARKPPNRVTPTINNSSGPTTLYPKLDDLYEQESAADLVESTSSDEEYIEQPYQSKYTRTLGTGRRTTPIARRSVSRDDEVKKSLAQVWNVLQRKYKINEWCAFMVFICLAVAIYVIRQ